MPPKQLKHSHASSNPHRKAEVDGQRSKNTIQRLNMYNTGKPIRNKKGTIVGGQFMMETKAGNKLITGATGRIAPDRRWFGNTRTITNNELEKFKDEMITKSADPYSIILRRKKIPMALLQDSKKIAKVNLLETESYEGIFGNKSLRKRPKIDNELINNYSSLLENAQNRSHLYEKDSSKDTNIEIEASRGGDMVRDDLFSKGQSKRIWAELYKVPDPFISLSLSVSLSLFLVLCLCLSLSVSRSLCLSLSSLSLSRLCLSDLIRHVPCRC
jgi:nuclear GTP-binding protein